MRIVLWADRHQQKFNFATTQSELGQKKLEHNSLDTVNFNTILLITSDGEGLQKLEAVLYIAKILSGPWKILYFFRIFPMPIRDKLYDFVGKNRYKWFGKSDYCKHIPYKYLKRISQ